VWAMADNPLNDYYVVTARRGQQPERWSWEILRKSNPLGIKMTGEGYHSDAAAQIAGKQALAEFLTDLSKEEKRLPRK
jgi:flavin reductase (DIM6/NTAB) family NADH-FMN oxidoreductase RutF